MKRKVTLKIFTPLLHEVEAQLEILHMKRDSFINRLIDIEIPHLQNDLNGKRLSVSARRHIAQSLKRIGTSQINVQLDSTIADHLDAVANNVNLVRDSFINRLLYFSLGSDSLLKYFDLNIDQSACAHHLQPSYLRAIHEIQADPLATLRKLIKAKYGTGLYLAPLPVELVAFECYLKEEIFWERYSGLGNRAESMNDLLQSFESAVYQDEIPA